MRLWLVIAGIDGALAVALAAAGVHGRLQPGDAARWFASASTIHMWHAVALVGVAALSARAGTALRGAVLDAAGMLFVAGTLLFAGTLYVQAFTGSAPLPYVAPGGGIALILGWLALAVSALPPRR